MALAALARAMGNRRPGAGLMIHSDRSVQYACEDFPKVLKKHGFIQNMSRLHWATKHLINFNGS
jgi:putative transposase